MAVFPVGLLFKGKQKSGMRQWRKAKKKTNTGKKGQKTCPGKRIKNDEKPPVKQRGEQRAETNKKKVPRKSPEPRKTTKERRNSKKTDVTTRGGWTPR